ncbi:50S ribosomal protein L20 [Allofustis seminis]|uniref:50S ribosomal protein L20 n=1 Tax=Allofustis seminis TaxID=166939 RepID=UPI000368E696|nr:50S ribosomal protein L20 [Allofustis seminis]
MARVKNSPATRRRRKRVLKLAKGYYGSKHKLFRTAKQQVMKSYMYAYRDRKQRKRNFRKLWIARINAGARMNGLSYSRLMHGLKLSEIELNRKVLADMAIRDEAAFTAICEQAKAALANH